MHRYLCLILTAFALLLPLGPARAATRVDTTFIMSDSVAINVAYYIPSTPRPASGYPAIVLVHGFGGSKNDPPGSLGRFYADSGYFCIAYTVRGQGTEPAIASGGFFTWFTGQRELRDCGEVIAWLRSRSDVNGDRIGVEGISQGGLTAWGAAIEEMNIRCIVPVIAVPHYSRTFTFNGANNYAVTAIFWVAKTFNYVRLAPYCGDTILNGFLQDEHLEQVERLRLRDLEEREEEITAALFLQCGWQDEIFSSREALRAFNNVRSPKKLMLYPGGHTLPAGLVASFRNRETLRFYRRWLKDDASETIMSPDSAVLLIDPGNGAFNWFRAGDTAIYQPPADPIPQRSLRLFFQGSGRLSALPPNVQFQLTRPYVQNISNESLLFRSDVFSDSLTITGAQAHLVANSTARKYQMNVLLFEYDSATGRRRPITRGGYEVRLESGEPNARRAIDYELTPQLYTIAPGRQLEAWVKFGFPGIPLQRPDEEFGLAPYPPQESAVDSLFGGPFGELGGTSNITLHLLRPRPSSAPRVELERSAAILLGTPARRGVPVHLRRPAPGRAQLDLIDLRGEVIRSQEIEDADIMIPTEDLAAGLYLLRLRAGDSSWSERFVVLE